MAWAQKGEIPAAKIGKQWRFLKHQLDRWLRGRFSSGRGAPSQEDVSLPRAVSPERVLILTGPRGKKEVLDALIESLVEAGCVTDGDELTRAVYRREELMSTGIGLGVAVPHVRLGSVRELAVAAANCPDGVDDYESMDGRPVKLVFMIVARRDAHADYIRVLSHISRRIRDERVRERLIAAREPGEFLDALLGSDAGAEVAQRGRNDDDREGRA